MANPYKKKTTHPQIIIIVGVLALLIVFAAVLAFGKSDAAVEPQNNETSVELLQTVTEEAEPVPVTKTRELDKLCEDYSFNQGDIAELDDARIAINRIGRSGVILSVNDQQFMLSEKDDEQVDDFLVELAEGDILYFGTDDPDNTVLLRLGCESSSENPADKYVREKGLTVCQQILTTCQNTFDVEME